MGHLRVTVGHPWVTIGHLRVIMCHIRLTIGHSRVTIGYLQANTTELHPKLRQTCSFMNTVFLHVLEKSRANRKSTHLLNLNIHGCIPPLLIFRFTHYQGCVIPSSDLLQLPLCHHQGTLDAGRRNITHCGTKYSFLYSYHIYSFCLGGIKDLKGP